MKMTEKISKREVNGAVKLIALLMFVQVLVFLLHTPPPKTDCYISVQDNISMPLPDSTSKEVIPLKRTESKRETKREVVKTAPPTELFAFDPNTVSPEQLQQLGLSPAQASSYVKYRDRGGRFYRKEDLLKVYVISDEFYNRVKDSVIIEDKRVINDIIELNSADSLCLVSLPGIGPYYASRIIEYRSRTGGFSEPSQLMEIRGIDSVRFSLFGHRVVADTSKIVKKEISAVTEYQLAENPYIGPYLARSIARYIRQNANEKISLSKLLKENVISDNLFQKLYNYFY